MGVMEPSRGRIAPLPTHAEFWGSYVLQPVSPQGGSCGGDRRMARQRHSACSRSQDDLRDGQNLSVGRNELWRPLDPSRACVRTIPELSAPNEK